MWTRALQHSYHNRIWRNSSDTILQRASRCAYVLSRAATPNYLSVCIGRILREKFASHQRSSLPKIFRKFLLSKLINNAVIDHSPCGSIGSNASAAKFAFIHMPRDPALQKANAPQRNTGSSRPDSKWEPTASTLGGASWPDKELKQFCRQFRNRSTTDRRTTRTCMIGMIPDFL